MTKTQGLALLIIMVMVVFAGCGGSGRIASVSGSGLEAGAGVGLRIAYSDGTDIYTMNPDGSGVTNLTPGPGSRSDWPTWSPDGTKIAFLGASGEAYYIMKADGTQVKRVVHHPTWNMDGYASWSPDGSRLAFAADPTNGGTWNLYIINTDGTGQTQLTTGTDDDSPAWSPDGATIAFRSWRSGQSQLWTIKPSGTGVKRLTNYNGRDGDPRWSPDGTKIAFSRAFGGNPQVCSMKADGTQIQRLTHDSAYDALPTWSPNGANIAFWRNGSGIYVMQANGTGLHLVKAGTDDPSWQRKG